MAKYKKLGSVTLFDTQNTKEIFIVKLCILLSALYKQFPTLPSQLATKNLLFATKKIL